MKILLTFIGNNDCFPFEKLGAILSILHHREFNKVYLLYNNEKYLKPASDILQYCEKHFPKLKVCYQAAIAQNPINYNTVYPAMYKAVKEILSENKNAEYTISLTSGTPTMHACWIFLQQGGMIDAKLIQVSREAKITEVHFELDDFPKIQNVNEIKVEMTKLARENINLKQQLQLNYDNIIGECPDILKVKEKINLFADTSLPIFIQGESGTGKELVAEAIHYNSSRKENNFIKINCGAIPPALFESEFFGHKKGSFTGAIAEKEGKFKQADGGTIFLDEIGDLPLEMQVKLLRVLEDGTFIPVGATKEEKVDVRIISATNQDFRKLVKDGSFREDSFYRLVHTEIYLPTLRERGTDKILIAQHIVKQLNSKHDKRKILDKSAIDLIKKQNWRGNVRQLKNALETAFVFPDENIKAQNMNIVDVDSSFDVVTIPEDGIDLEKEVIPRYYEAALKKTNGNAEQAAKLLNLLPHTFRARLKALNSNKFYEEK